jgi:hypothetical protein
VVKVAVVGVLVLVLVVLKLWVACRDRAAATRDREGCGIFSVLFMRGCSLAFWIVNYMIIISLVCLKTVKWRYCIIEQYSCSISEFFNMLMGRVWSFNCTTDVEGPRMTLPQTGESLCEGLRGQCSGQGHGGCGILDRTDSARRVSGWFVLLRPDSPTDPRE